MTNKEIRIRSYDRLRELLVSLGGNMEWQSGGAGGGGVYVLELWGKTYKEKVHNTNVNALDKLYKASVKDPKTWADYDDNADLVDDVRWKLMALFLQQKEDL